MPTKEVAELVCDMASYSAKWSVSRKAGLVILSIPLALVALIVTAVMVLS